MILNTFEISDAFPYLKKRGGDYYDKKRIISIYYNITPNLSCNTFTPKIEKASEFNIS